MNLRQRLVRLPFYLFAAALLSAAGAAPLGAAEDLHVATVAVEDRDRPAREAAFRTALGQVLVKLSGDRQILQDPRIEDLRGAAARYVQRFRYVDLDGGRSGLEVRFDGAALERQLAERGLPVWGADRPGILVWAGILVNGQRVLLGSDEGGEQTRILERVARERGVPLVFPVMDLEDQAAVEYADLAGGFQGPVMQASARYSTRFVLSAHVQPRGDRWVGRWRLYGQDFQEDIPVEADTLDAALDQGLQRTVDALGRRLAIAGLLSSDDHVLVAVDGVDSLERFQAVRRYLAELSVVSEVRPYRLEAEQAVFVTRLRGSTRDLERGVRLGRVLEPAEPPGDAPSAGAVWHDQNMNKVNLRLVW